MTNFTEIGSIDILPILVDLENHSDMWGNFSERSSYPGSPHYSTDCIVLRGNSSNSSEDFQSEIESDWWIGSNDFVNTRRLVELVRDSLKCERIGKVMFTSLYENSTIPPHIDEGAYSDYYQRIHIPILTSPDVIFRCGDESINMAPGGVYLFDHKKIHSVENNGLEERIHLIVDFRR